MNWILKNDGLSARRRSIQENLKIVAKVGHAVKRGTFYAMVTGIVLMLSSCREKTNGQHSAELKKDSTVTKDSLDKPQVNIKVNRHYDDKGNLIGFDSAYSSFYSNIKGDTARMDSLMTIFDRYYNRNHSLFFDKQFNTLFFNDSLRYPDFFHNDFFLKRYELNDAYLRGMMRRMDSIKNRFYQDQSKQNKDSKDQ